MFRLRYDVQGYRPDFLKLNSDVALAQAVTSILSRYPGLPVRMVATQKGKVVYRFDRP